MAKAVKEKWFKHTPGRTISQPKDKAADVMTAGVTELTVKGQFDRWFDHRDYARANCQIWPEDSDTDSANNGEGDGNVNADGEDGTHRRGDSLASASSHEST